MSAFWRCSGGAVVCGRRLAECRRASGRLVSLSPISSGEPSRVVTRDSTDATTDRRGWGHAFTIFIPTQKTSQKHVA
eukprot:1342888-Prymnesium_polylepis.1